MTRRQVSGDQGRAGRRMVLGLPAMQRVEVHGRGRAPSGTTGISCGDGQGWYSSRSNGSITAAMPRTAQSPRNGIEPCAIRPRVSISAHHTPRWPMQTRSDVERLGDDDVVDPRSGEEALAREPRDPAVAAGFLVDRARDLQGARQPDAALDDRLDGEDRRRRCPPSCRRCRGRRPGRRGRAAPNGSTVQPCPARPRRYGR